MPPPVEDEPMYPRWRRAVERVIATQEARDREQLGTQQWEAADRAYQEAVIAYRVVAGQI
jgi:hypothetical protein